MADTSDLPFWIGLFVGVCSFVNLLLCAWAGRDANARRKNGMLWMFIVLLFGIVGLAIWLVVRPHTIVIETPVSATVFEEMTGNLAELRTRQCEQKKGPFKTEAERENFKERERKVARIELKIFSQTKMPAKLTAELSAKAEKMRAALKKALEEQEGSDKR